MNGILFAFLLTLIAGFATGLGGIIAMLSKSTNKNFLAICLSFSAGVMIYVAFAEIFLESVESLKDGYGDGVGYFIATIAFFGGITIMALADKFIPHADAAFDISGSDDKELRRTGIMSATALAIHNLPEGIVTFVAAMYDPVMGIAVAIAIIIHNVPEGVAVAAPVYYSTGSKIKALLAPLGVGLIMPVGALLSWLLLHSIFYDIEAVFGVAFAVASGVMVFVAIHQLLPAAQKYGKHHLVMKWLFAGMAVMAISLVVLEFVL